MSATVVRVLPADVYDALEFSALVFCGIGADAYAEYGPSDMCAHQPGTDAKPLCARGHLSFVSGEADGHGPNRAMDRARITPQVSDAAVHQYNTLHGRKLDARVPFAAWCAELGVERGS